MNIYKIIRNTLSVKNQGRLSRMIYASGLKPTVNKTKSDLFDKGVVVFSADFEMAWAFRFSKKRSKNAESMGMLERENFPRLIALFDRFNIPVTWATVGHLFLNACRHDKNDTAHTNMPRPSFFENKNWKFSTGDWYKHDPCSDFNDAPAWYAPDLINLIINSKTKHEIGCHTFSHIDCTYQHCDQKLLNAEIEICKKLAKNVGVDLKSFVFPGGTFGNYEVLKANGFTCYRKPMRNHIDLPYVDDHGLVAIPSSLGLDQDPYGWSVDFHKKIIRSFIFKAIKHSKVCHFWFHPSLNPWYLHNVLPEVLSIVADENKKGSIGILTMADLAEKVKSND